MLLRLQMMAMPPHQRKQAPILRSRRIQFFPATQEVMIDHPDHMEPVGYDARLWKMLLHQRAVNRRQIHADDLHQMLAFEFVQITLQRLFTAACHHVIDGVIPQITEGGRVAEPPGEEMLVDAQNLRTDRAGSLRRQQPQIVAEPAFHRRAGDSLPLRQTAAADAVIVFLAHAAAKWLGGSHSRLDAGKALPEASLAALTTPFSRLQFHDRAARSPAFVPQPANSPVLHSQLSAVTVRAGNRSFETRPDPQIPR